MDNQEKSCTLVVDCIHENGNLSIETSSARESPKGTAEFPSHPRALDVSGIKEMYREIDTLTNAEFERKFG